MISHQATATSYAARYVLSPCSSNEPEPINACFSDYSCGSPTVHARSVHSKSARERSQREVWRVNLVAYGRQYGTHLSLLIASKSRNLPSVRSLSESSKRGLAHSTCALPNELPWNVSSQGIWRSEER